MKNLKDIINEKLIINKNTKINKYIYHPKDKSELISNICDICKNDKDPKIVDLNMIDTSNIDNMAYVFCNGSILYRLENRNIDISGWDVSNVTDFHNCFEDLEQFDCDLSYWDVSNCNDFKSMFKSCKSFKGNGLEKWDMSSATNIGWMFVNCKKLNIDLSNWNLSNVRGKSEYKYIFDGCNLDKSKRPKVNGKRI